MLGSLSTAGGAECTLEMQESHSKLFEFLSNLTQPAECGEPCLPGEPGLVPSGGVVGLQVQCASQWQTHSHPVREPRLVLVYHPGLNETSCKTWASEELVLVCGCSRGCPLGSGRWLCDATVGLMAGVGVQVATPDDCQ